MTACEIVEELSRADGSTGWTSMILNTTFFSCWLDPAIAAELLQTDPELGMAGLFAPIGRAEPTDDGALRLTGRFPFNSGSPHATWFSQGALVPSDDGPPQWRFLFVPRPTSRSSTPGTSPACGAPPATTSSSTAPSCHSSGPRIRSSRRHPTTSRTSAGRSSSLLASMMSGFPLGVARRSLDEFTALAETKGRGGGPSRSRPSR